MSFGGIGLHHYAARLLIPLEMLLGGCEGLHNLSFGILLSIWKARLFALGIWKRG
jgi:hypothetical protein